MVAQGVFVESLETGPGGENRALMNSLPDADGGPEGQARPVSQVHLTPERTEHIRGPCDSVKRPLRLHASKSHQTGTGVCRPES